MANCEYMEDCIHLKACRRMQKIIKGKYFGMQIARGCNKDCTAYETIEEIAKENRYYSHSQVQYAINRASEDGRDGYGWGENLVEDYV